MFNLKDIEVCFMDFDDTILLQLNRKENPDYYSCMIKKDYTFYNRPHRAVGRGIHEFVADCKANNISLFILTWSHSNLMYHAEKKWADYTFGSGTFEDVYVASSREYKIEVMKHYANTYGIPYNKCLFVDDVVSITDLAYKEGFRVASPQMIALEYG